MWAWRWIDKTKFPSWWNVRTPTQAQARWHEHKQEMDRNDDFIAAISTMKKRRQNKNEDERKTDKLVMTQNTQLWSIFPWRQLQLAIKKTQKELCVAKHPS